MTRPQPIRSLRRYTPSFGMAEVFKRAVSRNDLGTAERIWRAVAERMPDERASGARARSHVP